MATKILLKKSTTAGSSPLTSDLDQGELAVNLVDMKIYTKDSGNNITRLDGAYVDSVAPSNPVEGDLWYDTANNLLKAHNGSSFVSAGYQTFAELEDVNLTSIASGDHITWNGSQFVNSNFQSDVRAEVSGGTGVTYTAGTGEIAIGQAVETTSDVTFNDVNVDGNVSVATGIITLRDDNTTVPSGNAGITVYRGDTEPAKSLIWDETADKWSFGNETLVVGNIEGTIAGNTTGNVTGDILADDNTNVILQNGTDGTDAVFTGSVTGTVSDISNHDTSDLAEDPAATTTSGTMYFTDARARAAVSVTDAGGDGSLAYDNATGVITYTGPSAAEARAHISVTDNGGDGSLTYNSSTGVIAYTGPSAAEARAHVSGGTGVTYDSGTGVISIGQAVGTSDDVTFGKVTSSDVETATISHAGGTITLDPTNDGSDTGEVIIAGDLTVRGTTTTVSTNEVNIGDAIIVLNASETGTPSQNAGIEIERGTAANKQFIWNETDDAWDLGDETLQNVVIDGGTY